MSSKEKINGSLNCPTPHSKFETIQLSHGSGGKLTNDLITDLFVANFSNPALCKQDDQAIVTINGNRIAFTTDSYVVDPIFFEGGNIGDLAVNGTVNDIAMSGARPLYLSCGFIIEEGFSIKNLEQVVLSMKHAAEKAGVQIVTGDTKVVNKGKGDKLFINTSGIGLIEHDYDYSADKLEPGSVILINGTIGDHGMAILTQREGLSFQSKIKSDSAALNELVDKLVTEIGADIYAMRDATRGGVAAVLNEFATSSSVGIELNEDSIQVRPDVKGACELLGIDPLYVANEGKMVVVIKERSAQRALEIMSEDMLGSQSSIIGKVVSERPGMVSMHTSIGGWRMVDMPLGEQLPRIC